ncbi:MAG TPA: GH3 auxin-responsive promoter family protein [Dehalococcoidia bacterium]|nr:GH3 auxin-responsive promoter family protein [Dehalococcoidia bacterium]
MRSAPHPMIKSEDDRGWQKYCGFLDLTTEQFMGIQETLLLQELEKVADSPISRKLMGNSIPRTVDEFRRRVPLSSYQDYFPEFESANEEALSFKPYVWAHTSGASGTFKQVPYTREFYQHAIDNLMSAFILACSHKRGQSSLATGDKVLFNVAPSPYISGILAAGASQIFNLNPVMTADEQDSMDFKDKVAKGFELSLQTGVDILVAMTSVLVKLGNDFNRLSQGKRKSGLLSNPRVFPRLARAFLSSKLEHRNILPKDLWPTKALIGWGIDTSVYREQVYRYWGRYPYELHACTEAGIMALQSWNNKDLTLLPHSNFFEFLPEDEWLRSREDIFYQPRTVLFSEVKPGERYELVISSFYGMPFLRYRLGHLVRITALEDEEAQVMLPQMVFETRADELIDIAGFTRISEKAITQAIANAGIVQEDWVISKEVNDEKTSLHLYIELRDEVSKESITQALHKEMTRCDPGYRDLERMMDMRPLEVTTLCPGTFGDYYVQQRDSGAELMQCKPPRMNVPANILSELLRISNKQKIPVS